MVMVGWAEESVPLAEAACGSAAEGAGGGAIVLAAVAVSAVLAEVSNAVVKVPGPGPFSFQGCCTARPIMTIIMAARAAQRRPNAHDRAAGLSTTC